MKKKIVRGKRVFITATFFLSSILGYGQVGIGNVNPKSTLDVTGEATNASVADGLLAPRISRANLIAKTIYNSVDHKGTIVYVTDLSGTPNTQTVNVNKIGYYFLDNSGVWQRIVTDNTTNNIYTSSGTLTGNRTLSTATYTLNINSGTPIVNQVNMDYSTFSLDGLNNRIGIGTTTPQSRLHIATVPSNLAAGWHASLALTATDDPNIRFESIGNAVNQRVFKMKYNNNVLIFEGASDDGNSVGLNQNILTLNNTTGNVGIGVNYANERLQVYKAGTNDDNLFSIGNLTSKCSFRMTNSFNSATIGPLTADYLGNGDTTVMFIDMPGNKQFVFGDHIGPNRTGFYDLGKSFARWRDIYLTNSPNVSSDQRLKSNIVPVNNATNLVMKLSPKNYNKYTTFEKNGDYVNEYGFIAQELKKVVPQAVSGNENDVTPMGVKYEMLVPILTKAVQEQQEVIQSLEERIKALENSK
jgi:hypothetical protein